MADNGTMMQRQAAEARRLAAGAAHDKPMDSHEVAREGTKRPVDAIADGTQQQQRSAPILSPHVAAATLDSAAERQLVAIPSGNQVHCM